MLEYFMSLVSVTESLINHCIIDCNALTLFYEKVSKYAEEKRKREKEKETSFFKEEKTILQSLNKGMLFLNVKHEETKLKCINVTFIVSRCKYLHPHHHQRWCHTLKKTIRSVTR
jgi:hypothetical protein